MHQVLSSTPRAWGKDPPELVLLFASPRHDIAQVARQAVGRFPEATVITASSAGEFTEQGATQGGISALFVRWGEVSVSSTLLESMRGEPELLKQRLLSTFADDILEWAVRGRSYPVTLLLCDSFSPEFEPLVRELGKTPYDDYVFAGAGAADDGALVGSAVALGARAAPAGAVALHAFSKHPWGVGVDTGLMPSGSRMAVTRADGQRVIELDGLPAWEAYRARSTQGSDNAAVPHRALHTSELGVLLFDQLVGIRAPRKPEPDGSMLFGAPVPEGSTVTFVEATPTQLAAAATRAARAAEAALEGPAAGVLVFSSLARRLRLDDDHLEVRAVAEVFPNTPIAGFLSYAEVARTPVSLGGYYNSSVVVIAIPA